MRTYIKDIRQGIRTLLRQPGFSAVAVITLALGIGVNVALFSVVNAVLISALPFPQPEQLVTLDQSKPNFDLGAVPYPNFLDLREQNQTFSAMTISRSTEFSLIGSGEPERVNGRYVSAGFCAVFDLKPVLGRPFAPGEDEPGAGPVALISNELWQRKFGGWREVVGKAITLDDKSYSIIGVLPDFTIFRQTDVYVPIGQWNTPALKRRGAALGLHGIGRMKPGVTIQQAQADLTRVMKQLAITYPDTNKGNDAKVLPLKQRVVGDVGGILWMLLGAVGFVLLIACVNVGNLLLARSTGRTREFAIRAALGAGRWRLLRQSLTESVLLAIVGGSLGLIVASWGTSLALRVLPTTIPRAREIKLDFRVVLFAIAVSLLSGIVAGLAPALKNSRRSLSETLKEGGRSASGHARGQSVLVVVEVGLALVLLIGGGLMIRSLRALWNIDPGFRADNVLTFRLGLTPTARTANPESTRASFRELSNQLNALPGMRAVSFSDGGLPLQGADDLLFWIDGQPKPATGSEMNSALVYRVEPTYLTALGIPLKQGRFFTNQDDERSQPVVVVDEIFAHKYFGEMSPVGRRICQGDEACQTIVGVVGHVKQWSLDSDESQSLRAQLYEPFRQFPNDAMPQLAGGVGVVALTNRPLSGQFDAIREVVRDQNGANVVYSAQTMNEVIADSLAPQRFLMILLDAFAAISLMLASLGLYGVISYLVSQRTHELGIRIALGARTQNVLRLVLSDGLKMAVVGVGIGLVAALGLTRLLSKMLYSVSTTDPTTFALVTVLLTAVAAVACLVPAWRATRVDPLEALRYE